MSSTTILHENCTTFFSLILGLSSPCFAEYNPKCDFEDENVSNVTRIVKFPQYGIQMEIPENLRTLELC